LGGGRSKGLIIGGGAADRAGAVLTGPLSMSNCAGTMKSFWHLVQRPGRPAA
jgi:hypothetical protein